MNQIQDHSPLSDAVPDLVLGVSRDGRLLSRIGGRGLPEAVTAQIVVGAKLEEVLSEEFSKLIRQLVRKAIAARAAQEARYVEQGYPLQIRVNPEGPDRVSCVVRSELAPARSEDSSTTRRERSYLDRRGFLQKFQETLSFSVLMEKPASVIVIDLDGVEQIARLDLASAEQAANLAIMRLSVDLSRQGTDAALTGCLGQLRDDQLALVMQTTDRIVIQRTIEVIVASLSQPLAVADATFNLTPAAGVAVLGRDATSVKSLIDHARIAAIEGRRGATPDAHFFSQTLKMRAQSRLDIARELREAIASRSIGTRYTARHDLRDGRLVALLGYARWVHRIRGDVPPQEFLAVAEATGSAVLFSRALLERICADQAQLNERFGADVRLSYGPLRHHVLHEDFCADIERCLGEARIAPQRFEVRISERAFVSIAEDSLLRLSRLGVPLVVDEMGRGLGSLDKLARAPIWGLQLDRGWVEALAHDPVAQRICRAGIAAAQGLEVSTVASGVDCAATRDTLLSYGCHYGSGDLFPSPEMAMPAERTMVKRVAT